MIILLLLIMKSQIVQSAYSCNLKGVTTGVHNGTISDNYLHDMMQRNTGGDWGGSDGMTLKTNDPYPEAMNFSGVTVTRNHITNWGDDAIDMFGSYGETIEYNEIGPNNIPVRAGAACNGLKLSGNANISGEGTIIRYNYVHDFTNGCDGEGIEANGNGGMIVYGNLIEGIEDGHGMNMIANEQSGDGAWKIYNNTVTNVGGWGLRINYNQKTGTEVYNNIIDGDSGDFNVGSSSSVVLEGGYNILANRSAVTGSTQYYDCGTPCTDLGNTDPDFNNPANGEYWISPGSPAIDAGAYLGASSGKALLPESVWPSGVVAVDPYVDGTQREIGAYAYGGNTGNTPVDNCPSDPSKTQPGICGCGVSDADSDSDGIPNCNDACPNDPGNDVDGDEICAYDDNCPTVSNANQADTDGDGIGNACDISANSLNNASDSDSDGLTNLDEYNLGTDPYDIDTDNDGISDGYDPYPIDDQQSSCLDPIQNDLTFESFTTIQAAVNDPNAVDFDIIQITAADFDENILYDRDTILTLSGGYYCDYSDDPFKSSISSLTIRSGAIIIDNLVIN